MAIDPQYGTELTADELSSQMPMAVAYGVTPANKFIPVKIDAEGRFQLGAGVTLDASGLELGDVGITGIDPADSDSKHEIAVFNLGTGNGYSLRSSIFDGVNHLKINADGSINADITSSVSIPVTIEHNLDSIAIYGTDGTTDRFIKTDTSGNLQVGIINTSLAVTQSTSPWVVSGTVTVSGSVDVGNFPATQPVSGSVSVSNFPASQAVTGTFWQTTQPVSGSVTANAGTGTFTVGQATGTNLHTVVDSGSVAVTQSTSPWVVSGTVTSKLQDGSGNAITSTSNALNVNAASWLGSTVPTIGQKTAANSIPVTIASDQVLAVSFASSSSNLDNGKVFYASVDNYNLAVAASNNPIFLFKNPIDSGKTMYIFSVNGNCKIQNVQVTFTIFKNPTITANGTSFTPINANFGSGNSSVLQVYTTSTISSTGTLVVIDQVGQNANSSNMIIIERIAVPPGNNVLITGAPFSNNRAIILSVGWVEA